VRIVAKIGTSSTTDERGAIERAAIAKLCDEVAQLRADGHEVVVVSSGAVAAGVAALRFDRRPADVPTLQATAAVGQPRLMEVYNAELARHGLVAAQTLLVPHDFVDRRQYLHARRTVIRLLELGAVPIVNENDAIASDEIRYGDNDRLSALVAHSIAADVLVLLTDTEGLYTADPRHDPSATLIRHVASDDPLLAVSAGSRGTARGSGGMASKLQAARVASWSGVRTVIAKASRPNVLVDAVSATDGVGTSFEAHQRWLPARKLWIAFAAQVSGVIVVDDGARRALVERNVSLLPAGVTEVHGDFDQDDTVEVRGVDGTVFARGLVNISAVALRDVVGLHTRELPPGMVHEVIHKDDLVLVP
jgi:glutamate 5-kinase